MTTKEKILKVVKKLPSNSSIEDVMEHLYLLYKIERGVKQANAGEKVSHKIAKDRMKKWLS